MIPSFCSPGKSFLRITRRGDFSPRGFTLVELLVVVVILGIASSIVISFSLSILRRERVNSLALRLAGWIEEVRNLSARRVGAGLITEGCAITFASSTSNAGPGTQLASVSPAGVTADTCAPRDGGLSARDGRFLIPNDLEGAFSFTTTNTSLIYTPRGTTGSVSVSSTGAVVSSGDIFIKILLNGSGPMRCLRISETLAVVDIASVNTASIGTDCGSNYSAI